MRKAELKRLQKADWEFTRVQDLLGLSDAESKIIEMKVASANVDEAGRMAPNSGYLFMRARQRGWVSSPSPELKLTVTRLSPFASGVTTMQTQGNS